MRFPVIVRHRASQARIYAKTKSYPFYRLAFKAGGKRIVRSFRTYSEARKEAEAKVREMSDGSQSLALSAKEANEALAIRDALAAFKRETGRTVTALQAVTHYVHAAKLLGERPLTEAVEGYLQSVAIVRRKLLAEAVAEFCEARAAKAVAKPGKRPALHATYVKDTARWLHELSAMFPGHCVNEITKDFLNLYVASHAKLSAKSRNDRRACLKLFLSWCVRQDYLAVGHRLFEADALRKEASDTAPIDYYRPAELCALLENSNGSLRAMIALQSLGGLRLEESFRLDWRDVFGIPGHIEISSSKSKTRQRRLAEICPSLEQWLAPYRGMEGKVAGEWQGLSGYVQAFSKTRDALKIPSRRNGLRHGFVTYHFALHSNENLTAAQAGNSPAMIHAHYKGLATKAEAEKWFAVTPLDAAKNVISLSAVSGKPAH